MTEKTLKFNAGEITTNFNKTITVHVDLERNKTWLEIPGQPIDNIQVKKMVRVTPPTLTKGKRYFIVADDHKGNSTLMMVQGKMNDDLLENAKKITDSQFIELAQSFLDDMKKEADHE